MKWQLALLLTCGCTSTDNITPVVDATVDSIVPVDASDANDDVVLTDSGSDAGPVDSSTIDAFACDPTKPFAASQLIPGLSTSNLSEFGPRFMPDELTGYLLSADDGGLGEHLYVVTRPSLGSPFKTKDPILPLNIHGYDPFVTTDGLSLYFSNVQDIMVTTRPNTATPFNLSLATSVSVNGPYTEQTPFIAFDGALWFSSNRATMGGAPDIYRAPPLNGGFGAPVPVTELNGNSYDNSPVLAPDGLSIYFASDRGGGTQIWTATRAKVSDPFSVPIIAPNLWPANDAGTFMAPSWISPDNCRLYLQIDPTLGSVRVAQRPL